MKKILLLTFVLSFTISQKAFSDRTNCTGQINFLNKFLKLEKAGGRLQAKGRIYSMTTDDTHWETATVIKSYNFEFCDLSSGEARITVAFEVVGTMASSPSGEPDFIQEPKTENVDFFVTKKGSRWKITDLGQFRPHVSATAAARSIDSTDGNVAKRAIASLKKTHRSALNEN